MLWNRVLDFLQGQRITRRQPPARRSKAKAKARGRPTSSSRSPGCESSEVFFARFPLNVATGSVKNLPVPPPAIKVGKAIKVPNGPPHPHLP